MLGSSIVQLLFAQVCWNHGNRVYPRLYLKAALETITLAIIVTWIFTIYIFKAPEQIWQHPAFVTLGAFNFCFGWYAAARLAPTHRPPASLSHRARALAASHRDFAPGNYIGLLMNSFIVYFLWRYTILVNMRLKLLQNTYLIDRIAAFWNYVHALSGSVFLLIFLAGPIKEYAVPMPGEPHPMPPYPASNPAIPLGNWAWHTVAFFLFVIASYLGFVFTYIESKYGHPSTCTRLHPFATFYTIVLTIANLFMMIVYIIQIAADTGGEYGSNNPNAETCNESVIPSVFHASDVYCSYLSGQTVIVTNWFWFLTFMAAPYFVPPELPITESYQIGELGDGEADGIQMH